MKYRITLEVMASQAQSDGQFTHDCGICRWRKGDWLIESDLMGPVVFSDEEFKQRFTPVERWDCSELEDFDPKTGTVLD